MFLIMPAKVALFLKYETTHEKVHVPSVLQLTILTLSFLPLPVQMRQLCGHPWHLYQEVPGVTDNLCPGAPPVPPPAQYRVNTEVQINLCTDNHIWDRPPSKVARSSTGVLPAAHPSCCFHELTCLCSTPDTNTSHQLVQCLMWCLTNYTAGPRQVFIGIHDHAMLLLSTASAFCGDSSWMLLWSDLFKSSVHLASR